CRSQMDTALNTQSSRLFCYASLCARSIRQRDCLTALSPGPRKSARPIPLHLLLESAFSSFILISETASQMSVCCRQFFPLRQHRLASHIELVRGRRARQFCLTRTRRLTFA